MQLTEYRFRLPALELQALTNGPRNGPVLLALHGWLDNAASFQPLLPYLNDFQVYALDFPGHGWSAHRSPDAWYSFVEWVADVVTLLQHQNWTEVHLVGHSMGGFVAQLVAAAVPERLASLHLIEAFGLLTQDPQTAPEQLQRALAERQQLFHRQPPVYRDLERVIRLRAEKSQLTPALAELLVRRNMYQDARGWHWRVDPRVRLASPVRFTVAQATALIGAIQTPVQLIRGSQGYEQLTSAIAQWGHLQPEMAVTEIAGGHHVHMEQPEKVAVELRKLAKS